MIGAHPDKPDESFTSKPVLRVAVSYVPCMQYAKAGTGTEGNAIACRHEHHHQFRQPGPRFPPTPDLAALSRTANHSPRIIEVLATRTAQRAGAHRRGLAQGPPGHGAIGRCAGSARPRSARSAEDCDDASRHRRTGGLLRRPAQTLPAQRERTTNRPSVLPAIAGSRRSCRKGSMSKD